MVGSMKVVVRGFLILSIILTSSCVGAQSFGANQTSVKHAGVVDEAVGDGNDMDPEVPQFRSKTVEVANKTLVFTMGETIRINCGVKGYPKPDVIFYKGDKLLREPTPEDRELSRVRVERTTLRIYPAISEDSGIYTCVALTKHYQYNTSLTFEVRVIEINDSQGTEVGLLIPAVALRCMAYSNNTAIDESELHGFSQVA